MELWSKVVRLRDRHCQKCFKIGKLDAHHIFTRSKRNTRYDLENGITLCSGCHTLSSEFSAHQTPREFFRWLEQKMGTQKLDYLEHRSNTSGKGLDLKLVEMYLRNELKKYENPTQN